MTRLVAFRVVGIPAPQGSKTAMPNGAMVEAGSATGRAKVRAWRHDVQEAAATAHGGEPTIHTPVVLSVTFVMPRPKSRKRDVWHATTPDLDKLLRSTGDALVRAGVIRDDSLIVAVHASKVYADHDHSWTGAHVTIDDVPLVTEAVA